MLTSTRFAYVYPQNTDTPDLGRDFAAVATAIEKAALYTQGAIGARPAAAIQGRFYASTDETPRQLYYDTGSVWFQVGALAANAVTSAQIADGAITNAKLADGAVTSIKIADGTIVAADIADNSLTAAKLVDGIVPSRGAGAGTEALRSLGTGAGQAVAGNDSRLVDMRTPADNTVTTVKIVDGAVNSAKILDGSIVDGDLAADTLTARVIAPGAIGTSEVADASLYGTDLVADSITAREIAAGAVGTSEVADGSLLGTDLAVDAITAREIAAGAAGTSEIANAAVTAAKQADGTYPVGGGTISAFGNPVDGKVAYLYLDGNVIQFTYIGSKGKWVSTQVLSGSGRMAGQIANAGSFDLAYLFNPTWVTMWNYGFRPEVRAVGEIWSDDSNGPSGSNALLQLYAHEMSVGNDQPQFVFGPVEIAHWFSAAFQNYGDTGWYLHNAPGVGRGMLRYSVLALGNWYAGGSQYVYARASIYMRWVSA